MGGYEWAVDEFAPASGTMGIFVREENSSAPDGCDALGNGGISGMNVPAVRMCIRPRYYCMSVRSPGGKDGARIRMYHPFRGRCIVQQILRDSLCYIAVTVSTEGPQRRTLVQRDVL